MAALLASLTTFLRMSADLEITVLKASGLSLFQLLPPIIYFGIGAMVFTGVFTLFLTPLANSQFRVELLNLAKVRADLAIREQVFVRDFPGLTIYVGQLPSQTDSMQNVIINDRRSQGENTFIIAEQGRLDVDRVDGLLLFQLKNGVIDRVFGERTTVDSIFFDTYELKIFPGSEFSSEENSLIFGRSEIPTSELLPQAIRLQEIGFKGWIDYILEYHRRYAFPIAAFLMATIGMPLGASFRTRGRNFGLVVGLLVFLTYYTIYTFGMGLGSEHFIPPLPAIWTANCIVLVFTIILFKGLNRSAAIDPAASLRRFSARFYRRERGPL
jgi:lipopolysaccharide export system permease protein